MIDPLYFAPETLSEALDLVSRPGAAALAGGTDLVPRMRSGQARPSALVDLRLLPMRAMTSGSSGILLGACVTHHQVACAPAVLAGYPALMAACGRIGSPPIQNRGTIGGNLANLSPAADTAPALLVYDAQVTLASPGGTRTIPLDSFFSLPGRSALSRGELLIGIHLPYPPARTASRFVKMGRRQAMATAVVSVAARLTLASDGSVAEARLALGSVGPTPVRASAAERALQGEHLNEACIAEAAHLASLHCEQVSDGRASAAYRRRMVEVQVRRVVTALCLALGRAEKAGD